MECVIQAEPQAVIKWTKEGRPVFAGRNLVLQFDARTGTASLMIPQVMPRDAGKYSVEAKNKHGVEACTADLKVVEGLFKSLFHSSFNVFVR